MTSEQQLRLVELCARYGVTYRATDYQPTFDLPSGYVAGWIGGESSTIYVGVSPDGRVSS